MKGLFTELCGRLQEEASSEASRTACCDEETSKAIEEKEDLEADIAKHSSRLETAVSGSATLDVEICALLSELGALSKRQLQFDTMRVDERQFFAKTKAGLEQGIAETSSELLCS